MPSRKSRHYVGTRIRVTASDQSKHFNLRGVSVKFVTVCVAALVSLFGLVLGMPSTASAAVACVFPTGSNHTGGDSAFSSAIFGASARIETNQPDLCGADATSSGSSGPWAMVTAHSDTYPSNFAADGWAQTGYQQTGSNSGFYGMTGIYTFSQFTKACKNTLSCGASSDVITDFWNAPSGPETYSAVQFADGYIHMHVNSHHLAQTTYTPAGDWDAPWQGQFYGETLETESDQVGTQSDQTSFDYIYKYDSSGNANFFATITPYTDYSSHYHSQAYSPAGGGEGINIWTNPLTR